MKVARIHPSGSPSCEAVVMTREFRLVPPFCGFWCTPCLPSTLCVLNSGSFCLLSWTHCTGSVPSRVSFAINSSSLDDLLAQLPIVLCTVTVRSIGKDVLAKAWGLCKCNIVPEQGREEDSPEVAVDFFDDLFTELFPVIVPCPDNPCNRQRRVEALLDNVDR